MATNEADSEIRAVLDGMIEALNSGDRDRLRTFLTWRGEGLHVGSDEKEWMTDDQLVESLGGGEVGDITIVVTDWTVHGGGDGLAWAAGHARFEGKSKRSATVRLTAVLAKEGDHWLVVHSHASLGVPNEEMFG
jgi:SnoaL-like domain